MTPEERTDPFEGLGKGCGDELTAHVACLFAQQNADTSLSCQSWGIRAKTLQVFLFVLFDFTRSTYRALPVDACSHPASVVEARGFRAVREYARSVAIHLKGGFD